MGLWDKLKSAANYVTGGAAEVGIDIEEVVRGEPVTATVVAQAKADLEIKGVYLKLRCVEHAKVHEVEFEDGEIEEETEKGKHEAFETKVEAGEDQELSEGEEYSWEIEFTLPEDVNPTLHGETIKNIWEIQAGLDAPGNDPDSGWVEVEVR